MQSHMKKGPGSSGRRHGLKARLAVADRDKKTVLCYERGAKAYLWTTERERERVLLKH